MSTADLPGAGTRGWPQLVALVLGVVYLLIGVIGFFVTGVGNFFGNDNAGFMTTTDSLLGFMVNPMHNVVHIVIGVAGIALSRSLSGARTYGWLLLVGYGAAFLYGLFAVDKSWDFLNLNWADNVLHLVTAAIGLVVAVGPVARTATARGPDVSLRSPR